MGSNRGQVRKGSDRDQMGVQWGSYKGQMGVSLPYLCVKPSAASLRCVAVLSAWPPAGSAPPSLHHTLSL